MQTQSDFLSLLTPIFKILVHLQYNNANATKNAEEKITGSSILQKLCTYLIHHNTFMKTEFYKRESTRLGFPVLSHLALHWIDTNISEVGAVSIT
jgi:hypothetical protein